MEGPEWAGMPHAGVSLLGEKLCKAPWEGDLPSLNRPSHGCKILEWFPVVLSYLWRLRVTSVISVILTGGWDAWWDVTEEGH